MSYFVSPEFFRVALLGGLVTVNMKWLGSVNQTVPDPYLDEIFHIPQAQAYWEGNWSQWDPKITTPPGLYCFSHAVNSVRGFFNSEFEQTTYELRFANMIILHLLLVALYILTAVEKKAVNYGNVLQREFAIIEFPLLFFFSGLYYTDLASALTVVLTYIFWSAGLQVEGYQKLIFRVLHFVSGLMALATRQTNIFWVAVFLGGLQVVKSVKGRVGEKKIHDQPISEAFFEDFPITCISLAESALPMIPQILFDLWPQLLLLMSFGGFVLWNGGVVLGDKENHIATLNFPQMLYLWPAMIFFSWPVLIPQLSNLQNLRRRLPRLATCVSFLVIMTAIVNANTVIHPFTLADNRHYTFYVFRMLRSHWLIKYLSVPIYLACAWLVILPLSGTGARDGSEDIVRVTFILVWLLATTLSLVTAPLVEPRYFIMPWLVWRIHVPEVIPPVRKVELEKKDDQNSSGQIMKSSVSLDLVLQKSAQYSPWIEMAWYMTINAITCYLFLYKGFSWPQEPGKIQRFMW